MHIPLNITIMLGLHKFSLQATIHHHGPSMYCGHYTTSINCCKNSIAMGLAHLLHPIRRRSRKYRWNLWVGWCASSWIPWFWIVYSIYYYIRIMYDSCIINNRNKLFLKCMYITRVRVAMTVCWIWYCYSFLPGSKCIFQLCNSGFSIS